MTTIMRSDIKTDLGRILRLVQQGEEIVIQGGRPQQNLAVIISYETYRMRQPRPLGLLKGKATCRITSGFAMSDEELVG